MKFLATPLVAWWRSSHRRRHQVCHWCASVCEHQQKTVTVIAAVRSIRLVGLTLARYRSAPVATTTNLCKLIAKLSHQDFKLHYEVFVARWLTLQDWAVTDWTITHRTMTDGFSSW